MGARKKKPLKSLPRFESEEAERAFWSKHDSTEYIDWSQAATVVFPQLKPSTTTISLRLPDSLLEELKLLANKRDVPYQSLLKVFLAERIESERRKRRIADDLHPVPPSPRLQLTGARQARARPERSAGAKAKDRRIRKGRPARS
jgi:predicted DNA binding CopG/RHH family protein